MLAELILQFVLSLLWLLLQHHMHPPVPQVPLPADITAAMAKIGNAADKIAVFVDHAARDAFWAGATTGGFIGALAGIVLGIILAGLFIKHASK